MGLMGQLARDRVTNRGAFLGAAMNKSQSGASPNMGGLGPQPAAKNTFLTRPAAGASVRRFL